MQPVPLSMILTGFSGRVLFVCFALCAAFVIAKRFRPETRVLPVLRLVSWCAAPTAVAAVVNLVMQLSRSPYNHPLTYPFFANPMFGRGTGLLDAVRALCARPGVWPWAAVAVASAALVAALASFSVPAARRAWTTAIFLTVLVVAAFSFALSNACIPDGFRDHPEAGRSSSLVAAWTDEGTTMLLSVPYMRLGSKRYMWEYRLLQRRFEQHRIIHAVSHPPLASLVVRWIGRRFGVRVNDRLSIREFDQQMRYAVGQTVVSALVVLVVFAFGSAMFGRAAGLLSAALWTVSSSFAAYASFAPDMNYCPVFVGAMALTLKLSDEPSPAKAVARWGIPLGALFSVLCLLTYSWCIATTVTAVFIVADGLSRNRSWRDVAARAVLPMLAFAAFAAFLLLRYRVDYLANYLYSSKYVSGFYHHDTFLQKAVYLLGGQAEWLYMAGAATVSCFFLSVQDIRRNAGERDASRLRFLIVLIAVVAIPFIFGPPCLKHEVARCWIWLTPVPSAFAASWLLMRKESPAFLAAITASVAAISLLLCSFAYFGA